jgi:D-alanine--poly(phosphoribitol) ligase subunit 1
MTTNPIAKMFAKIVNFHPDRTAIINTDGSVVTYKQLDNLSDIAIAELEQIGLVAGSHISIDARKSTSGLALLVASWKLSCSYTFINFNQPQERVLSIIKDSSSAFIFVSSNSNQDYLYNSDLKSKSLDSLSGYACYFFNSTADEKRINNCEYAYVMFTSGSTGKPKGVAITYEQVARFKEWLSLEFSVAIEDRFTSVNPWYFDNSVFDLYLSLLNGCTLVLCDLDDDQSGFDWLKNLIKSKPTIWFSVPSLIVLMCKLAVFSPNNFDSLRLVIFGGEAFPKDILKRVVTDFKGRSNVVSVYGPTEGTCICSVNFIKDSDLDSAHKYVSLGKFPKFFDYTLKDFIELEDSDSQKIATLHISGPNVINQYVTNVGQERFSLDSLGMPQYNTGDLVYLDIDTQELYFAGRADNQIKRNGFRIELEEIESVIEGISGVSACIAVFDSSKKEDLTVYVEGTVELVKLEEEIKIHLPIYMHPRKIRAIEKLPRNQNGKKDRSAAKSLEVE